MKIRNGFVSNSSSSSFMVMMKNNKKMSEENILETFDIGEKSPLYSFAKDLSKWMNNNLKERDIKGIHSDWVGSYGSENKSDDELIQEILDDCDNIDKEDLEKIKNKEYRYYEGSASDEEGGLEAYLCDTEFDIDTETLKIKGGGGY